jgi:small-conductance mechanosensitive channel
MDFSTVRGGTNAWLSRPLFSLGNSPISLASLLAGLAFIAGIWWLAGFIERSLLRLAHDRSAEMGNSSRMLMLSRLVRYGVWIVGTFVGLNSLGIDLTSVALLGSALAVGLGFGLQNIFSNFVAGIIILAERILKVGDFVELESGVRGHVREIAMRYARITTNDAVDILVPNAEFINGRVINWTFDNAFRRVRVPFGVAYGTPKELVREAGIAAAHSVSGVLSGADREPSVWLVAYGDSSMNYELVVWADRELTTRPASTHALLMWALDDELVRRGIEIPFPQRDLNIRTGTLDVRLHRQPTGPV